MLLPLIDTLRHMLPCFDDTPIFTDAAFAITLIDDTPLIDIFAIIDFRRR